MLPGAKHLQRFGAIHGNIDHPTAASETSFEGGPHAGVIVRYEHSLHISIPAVASTDVASIGVASISAKSAADPGKPPAKPAAASLLVGSRNRKVAPWPGRLSTEIEPACCSRMRRQTASPRPELPGRV